MTLEPLERHRLLQLSREVDAAVEPLWSAGNVALVLRLLLEDGRRLLESVSAAPTAATTELGEVCRQGSSLGAPELEGELTPAHRELLGRLASSRRRALAELRDSAARRKRLRALSALAAALLVGVALFFLFRNTTTARASGSYGTDFPASQAVDGLGSTEWLLPQQQTGWLELTFARPRTVRALVLRNSVNSHYRDRATKSFKVEAFSHADVVASAKGEFPPIDSGPGPLKVSLDDARQVTHVRITVESFHGNGGGLAEVGVE